MDLTVLGSGAAFSEVGHNAAYLLDHRLLLDCGAPVTSLLPPLGSSVGDIEAVLISHLHGDHVVHLPTLLVARRLGHPELDPPRLVGPRGFKEHLRALGAVDFGDELWERLETETGPLTASVEEWEDGSTEVVAGYEVEAVGVEHSPVLTCLGYRVAKGGVSFGYTGDTTYCPGLLRLAGSVDTLLCECSSFRGPAPTHLWAAEVERLMQEFPKLEVVITHLNERKPLPGALLASDGISLRLPAGAGD